MYKSKKVVFALFLFCLFFISCNSKKSISNSLVKKETSQTSKILVGFSIDTLAIERWQRDLDVFMNKVKELGADVIVQNAGNNLEEQNRQLLYLMEKNVDVIVVLPKQADGCAETIQKIKSKGIPVISYDRLARNSDIDLYISIDSEEVGFLMAKQMMRISKGNNWFCILGPKEDYNVALVQQGILKGINGSPVKLGHIFYTDGWNYDISYQQMVTLIANKNIPDAILCGNDTLASSVIQALNEYYPYEHIQICGQDGDIAACKNIVKGEQDFTIYKPINLLAERAATVAVDVAQGVPVSQLVLEDHTISNGLKQVPVIMLHPTLVDKSNLENIIINSGFHTKAEIYE